MLATIFIDILPMIVSTLMSAWMTHAKENAKALHEERMFVKGMTEAARKDQTKTASWSRKFIVQSVIGSLFIFPMLLTILNFAGNVWVEDFSAVAIYVPERMKHGGILSYIWTVDKIVYTPIYGFVLMPIHVLVTQVISGFYFGESMMRR